MSKTIKMLAFIIILVMVISIMPLNFVNAGVTDENSDGKIIRKTTTIYHTKVQGTLNIAGDNTYTKNYSSGDDYLDGNYNDTEIATIISNYKQDMQTTAANYGATINSISAGITDYYYDVHDEITQEKVDGSDVILVGDIDDLDSAYTSQGTIIINTIMDKYQIYTINGTATSNAKTATPITSANVTLTAPKVGDKVEKITKNDGYGDYEAQSVNPTVSTTTEGLNVSAFWVKGLEDLSEEPFYGTFEEGVYYYAMIDFEVKDGYELPSTFPDGIKVNGVSPDEVFAVYGGKYNHCIVKIKATATSTNEETTYEFIEGANQLYTIGVDTTARFRLSPDFSLFQNGGAVYVDGTETDAFTSESGSTIITLLEDFMSSLSEGEHTLKVVFNNGKSAETKFTVAKVSTLEDTDTTTSNNPKTGDNIITIFSIFAIATLGAFITIRFNKNHIIRKH